MSAVRLSGTIKGDTGSGAVDWVIEVQDTSPSAPATTTFIEFAAGTPAVTWNGKDLEAFQGIIHSTARVGIMINSDGAQSFVDDIASSQDEGRFQLVIKRGTNVWWAGAIVPDGIFEEDASRPYVFTVTATDALGMLKGVKFDKTWGTETYMISHLELIVKSISSLPVLSEHLQGIRVVGEWYADAMDTANCFIEQAYMSRYALARIQQIRVDPESQITYSRDDDEDMYTILSDMCDVWNARMYQYNGLLYFECLNEIGRDPFDEWNYFTNGVVDTKNTLVSRAFTINQGNGASKLTGGGWNYIPGINEAKIRSKVYSHFNLAEGTDVEVKFSNTENASKTLLPIVIDETKDNYLHVYVSWWFKITIPKSGLTTYYNGVQVWRLELVVDGKTYERKLGKVKTTGNGYEEWKLISEDEEWDVDSYDIFFGSYAYNETEDATNWYLEGTMNVDFKTLKLLAGGEPTMRFYFDGIATEDEEAYNGRYSLTPGYIDPADYTIEWNTTNIDVNIIDGNNAGVTTPVETITAYRNNSTGGLEKYERNIKWGSWDDYRSIYGLWVISSGKPYYAKNFGHETTSGTYSLHELLVQSYIAARPRTIKALNGTIWTQDEFELNSVIQYYGKYYFARVEYNLSKMEMTGQWVELLDMSGGATKTGEKTFFNIVIIPPSAPGNSPLKADGIPVPDPGKPGSAPPLITDEIALGNITTDITGAVTSIPIKVAGYNVAQSGDKVVIVNKKTGAREVLTLTQDVKKGDTTISVSGTLVETYGGDTVIYYQRDYVEGMTHTETKLHYVTGTVTGDTIPSGTTLMATTEPDEKFHKRYEIYVGGIKLVYKQGYTVSGNDIKLTIPTRRATVYELRIWKIDI